MSGRHISGAEPRLFGPAAAIVIGMTALAAAAIVTAAATALFVGGGPGSPVFSGTARLLWGPVLGAFVFVLASLRGDVRGALALRGAVWGWPILIGVLAMAAIAIAENLLAFYSPDVRAAFRLPQSPLPFTLAAAGSVLGAPVAEELMFRGFIYTPVRDAWGFLPALGITSLLFAGTHFDPSGVYPLIVLPSAFLLGWAREKSGSVFVPLLLHAGFNLVAVAAVVIRRL